MGVGGGTYHPNNTSSVFSRHFSLPLDAGGEGGGAPRTEQETRFPPSSWSILKLWSNMEVGVVTRFCRIIHVQQG